MRVGIDFDNTIVCFDDVFYQVALTKGLIPDNLGKTKSDVRDYLRSVGQEHKWTALQGDVYGRFIAKASMFPGVFDFLVTLKKKKIPFNIISHKTKNPIMGEPVDLHAAAYSWLKLNHIVSDSLLSEEDVYFETTKIGKISRITTLKCTHFIDDLPEFLHDPSFPDSVNKVLFDPNSRYLEINGLSRISSWSQMEPLLWN